MLSYARRIRSPMFRALPCILLLLLSAGSASGQNVGMGDRYHYLDSKADRTVTDFGSIRATSVRGPDGSLETILETTEGQIICRLSFDKKQRTLRYAEANGQGPRFSIPPLLDVTSDWANAQAFSLWLDRTAGRPLGMLTTPVYDGYYFRHPALAMAGRSAADDHRRSVATAIRRVRTEFPMLIAEAVRNPPRAAELRSETVHSALTARLHESQSARQVAILQWFPEAQTLTWKVEEEATSFIDPHRLAQANIEGWPFEPNPAWANLQIYSFFLEQQVEVSAIAAAMASPVRPLQTTLKHFDRPIKDQGGNVGRTIAPLCTNQPDGCTGLHWLDGTVYRQCCDEHDRCYYQNRPECCTWWSWFFPWQQGWSCAECNVDVVWCFLTGGGGGGDGGGPGGTNEDNDCHLDIDEYFCSAACAQCTWGF